MKRKTVYGALAGILLIAFLVFAVDIKSPIGGNGEKIIIFKSASCGCCTGWSSVAESNGYDVDVRPSEMSMIKSKYGIPKSMESCHTAVVGDYFVEGHVPLDIVNRLLEEKPDIDGIALPGMPSGSPGMPGTKRGTWTIYAIKDGQATVYAEV